MESAFLEAYGFQTTGGTSAYASAATRAFFVMDRRKVVLNGYCAVRTGLFAFLASDASVFARLARIGAFVFIVAHDCRAGVLRNYGNDALRANGSAQAATDTTVRVDVRNAVLHADRVRGASVGAIAETETTETAGFGTAEQHRRGAARGDTVVGSFL